MGNTLTIFDLDNTLIQGDSSTVWSQFMVREGLATQKGYLAREARLMADYDRGEMNIADYVALIQAPLAGIPKRSLTRWWPAACARRSCPGSIRRRGSSFVVCGPRESRC